MKPQVHGDTIDGKIRNHKSGEKCDVIAKISEKYKKWRSDNEFITGVSKRDINKKTRLLNQYKTFVRAINKKPIRGYVFTFQTKLEPTIIEEFLYYLFKDLPILQNKSLKLGPTQAYVDMGFSPSDIDSFEKDVGLDISTKDQDFAISRPVFYVVLPKPTKKVRFKELDVPVVAIEVKTWLDKTMLVGAAGTAERLKSANPNSLFIVVTETTGVGKGVILNKTRIDEIFVLRKQRSHERDDPQKLKPISSDVVWQLFSMVKKHLEKKWVQSSDDALSTGRLIQRN